MPDTKNIQASVIPCAQCPLAGLPHFRKFNADELRFVQDFKTGELSAEAGATILVEGSHSAHLFTVLSGWAFRYKTLEDGRRQILNYAVPGDLLGLQGSLMDEMQHTVEALSPLRLCVFERERMHSLFEKHAGLSFDITWMAAREESILDEHLLSVGRRSALERAAYLLAFLHKRGAASGMFNGNKVILPLTQQHIADTLGLSLVHTNKTLRRLMDRDMIVWREKGCEIVDPDGLIEISGWTPELSSDRPYL